MEDALSPILEQAYNSGPVQLSQLAYGQKAIFRVHRAVASDWIVRLYPNIERSAESDRVLALAHFLTFLEQQHYPAEQVVVTETGSPTLHVDLGQLLVTQYLGTALQTWQPAHAHAGSIGPEHDSFAYHNLQTFSAIGALLGDLHAINTTNTNELNATKDSLRGLQPASELAWATHCLDQIHHRVPTHLQSQYDRLRDHIQQIGNFDKCSRTLIHGDCHLGNVVMTSAHNYAYIDWDAAGYGIAITDLGQLLGSCTSPSVRTIDEYIIHAIIDGYWTKRRINSIERDHLSDAMRFRILVTLAGAFEALCHPTYDPEQRFYGFTYGEWAWHEEKVARIAHIAQEHIDDLIHTS